jgi:hypothetical protein
VFSPSKKIHLWNCFERWQSRCFLNARKIAENSDLGLPALYKRRFIERIQKGAAYIAAGIQKSLEDILDRE